MSINELARDLKNPSYELFMLLLSLLSLFNITILVLPNMDPLIKGVIKIMDIPITLAFMTDFVCRLFPAESKAEYLLRGWGWADLFTSMPVRQLKLFRIFRVVKAARLLRVYGLRAFVGFIQSNRAGSALFLTIFFVILVLEFGGAMIVHVEAGDPQANIKTAGDVVW
jgi:voltage-gated potassium channel